MPPKAKFTRQEIIDAAVDIARRAPLEAVTAQELASVLGTSTRPVFTYFRTLEEVRAAVVEEAGKIYGRYVERGLSMNPPFKGYGMETIRFAREEPNLFRLLFLRRRDTAEFPPTENHSADIRRAIRETFSLTDAQADELHRHLWIYVHGLCTLIVTGVNDIPDTEAARLLGEVCRALLIARADGPRRHGGRRGTGRQDQCGHYRLRRPTACCCCLAVWLWAKAGTSFTARP